tara:strand:+ start:160 stop:453 length:294 start_codon:yes stop_codon:yes gene_type:complete
MDGIGKMNLKGLFDATHLEEAPKEFEFLSQEKVAISYFMDDDYPARLKHCVNGPILLFQRGNIDLKNQKNHQCGGYSECDQLWFFFLLPILLRNLRP